MPFFAIYFHQHLGLRGEIVGLGFLLNSAMGVVAVLAGAYFTDRFGRKKSLLVSILASAVTHAMYPLVDGPTSDAGMPSQCSLGQSCSVTKPHQRSMESRGSCCRPRALLSNPNLPIGRCLDDQPAAAAASPVNGASPASR